MTPRESCEEKICHFGEGTEVAANVARPIARPIARPDVTRNVLSVYLMVGLVTGDLPARRTTLGVEGCQGAREGRITDG